MEKRYRIRGAVAGDIVSILALDREIETLPHWRPADYLAALPARGKETRIEGIRRCIFVAEVGSVIAGFAVVKVEVTEALAELESVGVATRARHSGFGRALCEAVIEWSERMGATEVKLEVRSRSTGPTALYETLGFEAVGRRAKYYREPPDDAILMRLNLRDRSASGFTRSRDL